MRQHMELITVNGEARIDTRLIAPQLGIEHEALIRTVRRYQDRLEQLGILRFENGEIKGRGQPEKYALLNEDQAIFTATLSRNTERVVNFKLQLTHAFREARTHQQAPAHQVNRLWHERLERYHRETRLPAGYWSVFGFVAAYCWSEEFNGVQLLDDALPDGSIGQKWCAYARACGLDMRLVKKYPHHYPDQRGTVQANIYPDAWVGEFWSWFHQQYLVQDYPRYLQTHARTRPAEPQQELLAPHKQSRRK